MVPSPSYVTNRNVVEMAAFEQSVEVKFENGQVSPPTISPAPALPHLDDLLVDHTGARACASACVARGAIRKLSLRVARIRPCTSRDERSREEKQQQPLSLGRPDHMALMIVHLFSLLLHVDSFLERGSSQRKRSIELNEMFN
jgi:hypothetical protein